MRAIRLASKLPPGPGTKTLESHDIPYAHKSPPAKHAAAGATQKSDYADPKNYKYPINNADKVRAAIAYFSRFASKTYSEDQAKSVAGRIFVAAKKFKIGVSRNWLAKYGLTKKSNRSVAKILYGYGNTPVSQRV